MLAICLSGTLVFANDISLTWDVSAGVLEGYTKIELPNLELESLVKWGEDETGGLSIPKGKIGLKGAHGNCSGSLEILRGYAHTSSRDLLKLVSGSVRMSEDLAFIATGQLRDYHVLGQYVPRVPNKGTDGALLYFDLKKEHTDTKSAYEGRFIWLRHDSQWLQVAEHRTWRDIVAIELHKNVGGVKLKWEGARLYGIDQFGDTQWIDPYPDYGTVLKISHEDGVTMTLHYLTAGFESLVNSSDPFKPGSYGLEIASKMTANGWRLDTTFGVEKALSAPLDTHLGVEMSKEINSVRPYARWGRNWAFGLVSRKWILERNNNGCKIKWSPDRFISTVNLSLERERTRLYLGTRWGRVKGKTVILLEPDTSKIDLTLEYSIPLNSLFD